MELDLDDRMVREMVDRNHTPREEWSVTGNLVRVYCDECWHPWPCPTRTALSAWIASRPEPRDPGMRSR